MEMLLEKDNLGYYNQEIFAKAGITTLYNIAAKEEEEVLKKLIETKELLLKKEPNNPMLKNALSFFLFNLSQKNIKEEAKERHGQLIKKINDSNKEIAEHALKKIKSGSTVFIHSLNNQLKDTILYAFANKNFFVNMVEHRPYLFGNHLAGELRKKENKATLFSDISLKDAITGADICLIGGEIVTRGKGAVAKSGSSMAVEIAKKNHTPIYVCVNSFKYDHDYNFQNATSSSKAIKAEESPHSQQSKEKMYEYIAPENINAYICEYGIFKPEHIQEEIRFYNRWMFI